MTPVFESAAVAAVFLVAFGLFAPALVAQAGDDWSLPSWVPASLGRRNRRSATVAASIAWTATWSLGGQILVLYLLMVRLVNGDLLAAAVLGTELVAATTFGAVLVLASRPKR